MDDLKVGGVLKVKGQLLAVPTLAHGVEAMRGSVIRDEDQMLSGFGDGLPQAWVAIHLLDGGFRLLGSPILHGLVVDCLAPSLQLCLFVRDFETFESPLEILGESCTELLLHCVQCCWD